MKIYFTSYNILHEIWTVRPTHDYLEILNFPMASSYKTDTLEYYVTAMSHSEALIKAQALQDKYFPSEVKKWRKDFGQI